MPERKIENQLSHYLFVKIGKCPDLQLLSRCRTRYDDDQ
jgi:hypothetical protein